MKHALHIEPLGELEIVMTRRFNAPRQLVYDAWTQPKLLKRWLGGYGDWTMPVCEVDLRVGGKYRYEWHHPDGMQMGISGEYKKLVPGECIVNTELFDEAWYPGEALITNVFTEEHGVTTSTMTIHYASKAARDGVLASPMESGFSANLNRLDVLLAEQIPAPRAVQLDAPVIQDTKAIPAAVISLNIPAEECRQVFGPAVNELLTVLKAQGLAPAGPLFDHHLERPGKRFNLEIGFPIQGTLQPSGRVKPGQLPAAQVVRTVYQGPFERFGEAWGAFQEAARPMLDAAGLQFGKALWQVYLTNPETTPDPGDYRTEFNAVVVPK